MAESNALVQIFLVAIAASATLAFSSRSWYCHRLAPRVITASVTPCRFPCLVVSPHVHPHIIVQNEADGTPCMIQNALHHEGKIGMCRNSFCVQELPHKVLKRKKRFICLYALARIYKLKKQRNKLEEELGQLKRQLAHSREGDVDNELAGRVGDGGNVGAEGFGDGMAGPDAGPAYGLDTVPSVGSGTGDAGFAATGSGGPAMRGVSRFGVGAGPSSGGDMGTAGVPDNTNYAGGPSRSGDDGTMDTAQVRLGHGYDMRGTSGTGSADSLGSTAERGGGGEAVYYG